MTLYGSSISYFTGKLENYFRLKGIDYRLQPLQYPEQAQAIAREVGVQQMPNVQLADGRWMTDSTAIIQWFEGRFPEPPLLPDDPLQAFACRLLEDWADEWLWRPAMHYRWYYTGSAALQSRHLADELLGGLRAPGALKRWNLRRRQRQGYTRGDGVSEDNRNGVEAIFLDLIERLDVSLHQRPYLIGERPSLADVGLSGPFFRHFALDPVPLAIIRERAPAVLEWVARLWNSPPERIARAPWPARLPDDLDPILRSIGAAYLPYLNANALAVAEGKTRFDALIDGVEYRGARSSGYRVWCLAELRRLVHAAPTDSADALRRFLDERGLWTPLWELDALPLDERQESGLPFRGDRKMLAVYGE